MKLSRLFSTTLREAPTDAEIPSHQLLLRAGYIRPVAAGIFSYLPLARRALNKIEAIIRQEIEAIGGQEVTMPVVHPADLWKETGRWFQIDAEMGRFKDRGGRDMALAMTHEEVVTDLARKEIHSYRQLPQLIYHVQTKWRDDPRPRAGLIRVREFTMKDSYSLDADWEGLDRQYRAHYQAYFNIFHRCGLPVIAVKSDTGMMGGQLAHEYMYLTPFGEDTLLICDCGYSANRQVARFRKDSPPHEAELPAMQVATPDCKTIEDLANFLGIPKSKTAKAVFMMATISSPATIPQGETTLDRFVFAVVRGDMEVNETKLANAVKARSMRPATEEEIRAVGAEPGYASPVGLSRVLIIVDDAVPQSPNLAAGANEAGYHLINTNYGRDYDADLVIDIASAGEGSSCPECGMPMRAVRGVETGNIFKLGIRYSEAMGANFVDKEGNEKPIIMGSYGIGSGRLLACVAEEHHDEYGLVWPITVAPFAVHLVELKGRQDTGETGNTAERLYHNLWAAGIETLWDDREESPGIKFNDADLIGLPIRLTVSERARKQGGVEFKRRDQTEKVIIPFGEVVSRIQEEIVGLKTEISAKVVAARYES